MRYSGFKVIKEALTGTKGGRPRGAILNRKPL